MPLMDQIVSIDCRLREMRDEYQRVCEIIAILRGVVAEREVLVETGGDS